jgi:putative RNA 2'-phosphotransferase
VSLRLRHDPDGIGLALGPAGWAEADGLIAASARHGVHFTRAELDSVVAGNDKRRFEYDAQGTRIRARQGHSVPVDLGYVETAAPGVLYHGTATRLLPAIRRDGLLPMGRHDVHLSADPVTARSVGARHGAPVVFVVDAAGMARAGHIFRVTGNGVWLTAAVPAAYLSEGP